MKRHVALGWFIVFGLVLAIVVVHRAETEQSINRIGRDTVGTPSDPETINTQQRREEWFFQQRAYPLSYIPTGARLRALGQLDQMEEVQSDSKAINLSASGTQWTSIGPHRTDGLAAGRVSALAIDPRNSSVVYLGAATGGVWKTTDGGATWTALTDAQPSLQTGAIVLDPLNPDTIYVGTGEEQFSGGSDGAGILKSVDGGSSWTQFPGPFVGPFGVDNYYGGSAKIGSLAIDPNNTQVLLAAVSLFPPAKAGIYRSTDGGKTWSIVLSGSAGTGVVYDPTNGQIAYAVLGEAFGTNPTNGVYKSLDAGVTWNRINGSGSNVLPTSDLGRIAISMAPSQPSTLYVAVASASSQNLLGLFKTVDAGQNWNQLHSTPQFCDAQCGWDIVVTVDPKNPNTIFAGGAYTIRLVRSLDGGSTWATLAGLTPWLLHPDLHVLQFTSDGARLYIGDDGGAWSSTNATSSSVDFVNLNDTLCITQFYPGFSIDPTNTNFMLAGTQDQGTLKYTGNFTWTYTACGDGLETAIDPTVRSTSYISCGNIDIEKSTANGDRGTWVSAHAGLNSTDRISFVAPLVMDPNSAQRLYFGTFRVYQTKDGAMSWNTISPDLTGGSPYATLSAIAVAPSDSNTVYAGSSDAKIHVSVNAAIGGPTWIDVSAGLPNRSVTQVSVHPSNAKVAYLTFSGYSGFTDTQGHVFKTTDLGASWSDISGNLPNIPVNDIVVDPLLPNTLYVATDIGVFSTSDDGNAWSILGAGLPRVTVMALKLHAASRTLRAGTYGRSMWDLQLPTPAQLLNISTRMRVLTGDQVLIGGFIITGTDPKKVIIRGMGPSLNGVGVTLSDPTLELHQGSTTLATNDNWKTRPDGTSQQAEIEATTIPPTNDLESAIVATLNPGAYTAVLAGKNGGTGVGLVEVYDLAQAANSKLANISTRGFVDTGNNVMIGGLIIGGGSGDGSAKVIVRTLGPSVPAAGALGDPTLELHDGSGTTIATNDNWKINDQTGQSQEAKVRATTIPPANDFWNRPLSHHLLPATTPRSCAAITTRPA